MGQSIYARADTNDWSWYFKSMTRQAAREAENRGFLPRAGLIMSIMGPVQTRHAFPRIRGGGEATPEEAPSPGPAIRN